MVKKAAQNAGAAAPTVFVPSVFEQYETDLIEQENGRWFHNIGLGMDIKLRRYTSRHALNNMARLQQQYRTYRDAAGALPDEIADELVAEHLATAIIADWKGPAFRMPDGTPIEFSAETAKMLMMKLPELRNLIVMVSNSVDSYRIRARKEIEGN
jgi:hypothetical protein